MIARMEAVFQAWSTVVVLACHVVKFAFIVTNLAGGGAEKAFADARIAACRPRPRSPSGAAGTPCRLPSSGGNSPSCAHAARTSPAQGALGKLIAVLRLGRLISTLATGARVRSHVSTLPFADEVAVRAACRATGAGSPTRCRRRSPACTSAIRARGGEGFAVTAASTQGPLIAVSDGVAEDCAAGSPWTVPVSSASTIPSISPPCARSPLRPRRIDLPSLPHTRRPIHRTEAARLAARCFCAARRSSPAGLLAERDPALSDLIRRRGLDGRRRRRRFQDQSYPWIAGAELLVLCSDHEGLPNVIIEALALDTPVVSTTARPVRAKSWRGLPRMSGSRERRSALAQAIARALAESAATFACRPQRVRGDTVVAAYEALAAERPSARGAM